MRCPYAALDAFLTEHRLCWPGLDEPDVSETLVTLWCSAGEDRGQPAATWIRSSAKSSREGSAMMTTALILFLLVGVVLGLVPERELLAAEPVPNAMLDVTVRQ
jgi:hypothetical protein